MSTWYVYSKFENEWYAEYSGSYEDCVCKIEELKDKFPDTEYELGDDAPLGNDMFSHLNDVWDKEI